MGSFTVDGLTFAVTGESHVELVGVAPSVTLSGAAEGGEAEGPDEGHASEASVANLTLPGSVTYSDTDYALASIGAYAFYLSGVADVMLPASVNDVDDRAFRSSDVANVTVADGNPSFSSYDGVLYDATRSSLLLIPGGRQGAVRISDKAEEVDASAFSHCAGVDSISVDAGSAHLSSWEGLLYDADGTTLLRVPAGATDITIREGCTTIAAGAMEGCASLERINAPSTVTSISPDVFHALPTVSLPAAAFAKEATQLTAMVALSATGEDSPRIDPSTIFVTVPSEANAMLWRKVGLVLASNALVDADEPAAQSPALFGAPRVAGYDSTANFSSVLGGGNAQWSFNSSSGNLTICCHVMGGRPSIIDDQFKYTVGSGDRVNYSAVPWYSFKDEIKSITFIDFDATDTTAWFAGCRNLESIRFVAQNTAKPPLSSVVSTSRMFESCGKLKAIPSNFTLEASTELVSTNHMFTDCVSLSGSIPAGMTLTASGKKLVQVACMFANCVKLSGEIPFTLENYAGTGFDYMFASCRKITNIPSRFTMPSGATVTSAFKVTMDAAAIRAGQGDGSIDLNGKLVTTYAGTNSVVKGLNWDLWERSLGTQRYEIVFNTNGGSGEFYQTRVGAVYGSQLLYSTPVYRLPSPALEKTGYGNCDGWILGKATGDKTHGLGAEVSNLTATPNGTVTFYAHYTPNDYAISFDVNGGKDAPNNKPVDATATFDAALPAIGANKPVRDGYAFSGWYDTSAATGGNMYYDAENRAVPGKAWDKADNTTLYARWTPNSYTIAFDSQGGPEVASMQATYDSDVTLPQPGGREGYAFGSWNTEADGSGAAYQAGIALAKPNLTTSGTVPLYAQWVAIEEAVVPLEVTARVDVLGIEDQTPATGYIESRCGEPLKVASVEITSLPGATELFGAGNESQVQLQALAGEGAAWQPGGANASFSFPLGASATESDAGKLAALTMQAYEDRVPISYRFAIPEALLSSLAETTKPVCSVAYTVALVS